MKKIFISMLLILGFGLGAYANDNTPQGVVLAYWEALKKGDLEKAKSYLDEKSITRIDNKGRVRHDINRQATGNHRTLKYSASDISQYVFRVENTEKESYSDYRVYFTNPTSETEGIRNGTFNRTASIKKIKDKWKITYVE